jgi:hypothetical protein
VAKDTTTSPKATLHLQLILEWKSAARVYPYESASMFELRFRLHRIKGASRHEAAVMTQAFYRAVPKPSAGGPASTSAAITLRELEADEPLVGPACSTLGGHWHAGLCSTGFPYRCR